MHNILSCHNMPIVSSVNKKKIYIWIIKKNRSIKKKEVTKIKIETNSSRWIDIKYF